jgi:capsular exopolysaccharide synthesis family protein
MDDSMNCEYVEASVPSRRLPRPSVELPPSSERTQSPKRATPSKGLDAFSVLRAALLWWKVALPSGILLAVIGAAVVLALFQKRYMATAFLRIEDRPSYIVAEPRDDRIAATRFVNTQIQLLQHRKILTPVLAKPEVAGVREIAREEDKIAWLGKNIVVKPVGQSDLYAVSLACSHPADAFNVVNEIVDEYFKYLETREAGQKKNLISLLADEKKNQEKEVTRLRSVFQQMASEAGGKEMLRESGTVVVGQDPLTELQKSLALVTVDIEVLQARMDALKEMVKDAPRVSEEGMEGEVERHPEVQHLQILLQTHKAELEENRQMANPNSAKMAAARADLESRIEQDKKTLAKVREVARADARAKMESREIGRRKDQIADLDVELQARKVEKSTLEEACKKGLKSIKDSSRENSDVLFAKAELSQAQQLLDQFNTRIKVLQAEQRAPSRVWLEDKAILPVAPVEWLPYKQLAGAALGGFFLPFLLAVAWERLVRRIGEIRDLENESRLAVVGEVSQLPRTRRGARSADRTGEAIEMFEESIDSLRTTLMLAGQFQDVRVLAVTSAGSREGKTSVSVSLAISFARALSEPTLLIDADMRAPDIHRLFDKPLGPGLAEVLAGEAAVEDAILTDCGKNVHVLPAGRLTASPHRLLSGGKLNDLLAKVSPKYRYIIVDTPPVLAAAESMIIAREADLSLLCAMRNVSCGVHVRKASEKLLAAGSRLFGAVLSGVPSSRYGYHYNAYRHVSR